MSEIERHDDGPEQISPRPLSKYGQDFLCDVLSLPDHVAQQLDSTDGEFLLQVIDAVPLKAVAEKGGADFLTVSLIAELMRGNTLLQTAKNCQHLKNGRMSESYVKQRLGEFKVKAEKAFEEEYQLQRELRQAVMSHARAKQNQERLVHYREQADPLEIIDRLEECGLLKPDEAYVLGLHALTDEPLRDLELRRALVSVCGKVNRNINRKLSLSRRGRSWESVDLDSVLVLRLMFGNPVNGTVPCDRERVRQHYMQRRGDTQPLSDDELDGLIASSLSWVFSSDSPRG